MKRKDKKRAQLQRSLDYTVQQIAQADGQISIIERAKKRHTDARDKIQAQIDEIDNPKK